jgi:hypothetical protein
VACESDAFGGQAIDVGRVDIVYTVAIQFRTKIVNADQQHVGPLIGGRMLDQNHQAKHDTHGDWDVPNSQCMHISYWNNWHREWLNRKNCGRTENTVEIR